MTVSSLSVENFNNIPFATNYAAGCGIYGPVWRPGWNYGPIFDPCFDLWGSHFGFGVPYTPVDFYLPGFSPIILNTRMPSVSPVPDTPVDFNLPGLTIVTTNKPASQETYNATPVYQNIPIYTGAMHPDKSLFAIHCDDGFIGTPTHSYTQQVSQDQTQRGQVSKGYQPTGSVHDTLKYIDGLLGKNQPAASQTGSASFGGSLGMTSPQQKQETFISTQNTKGEITTPSWYEDLAAKAERKEPLSEEEKSLKANFDKMYEKYNPYQMQNGYPLYERQGIRKLNSFGNKIHQLMAKLLSKDRDGMRTFINRCSNEELAAIEFHFNIMTAQYADVTGGKTLREMIKDCSLVSGFTWTGVNTQLCQEMFDKLDEAAMVSPRNVAYALHQAINNHHIFSSGFDETRIVKLLKASLKKGSKFMDAVKVEYGTKECAGRDLSATIVDKWFKSAEIENLKSEVDKAQ